ncbi:MAG: methyltransferase domain-containing protein, partial [Ferrimonas sp.]
MLSVADCFASAAPYYDEHAQLQRWAGRHLLDKALPAAQWLDIGSGTGYLSRHLPSQQVLGLDLAMAMLRQAHSHARVQADMHALPLQNGSMDAIAANLSLQWSRQPVQVLTEAARVCRPQGQLLFTVPAADTFPELQSAIATQQLAVNVFPTDAQWQQWLHQSGWQGVRCQCLEQPLYFADPKALLLHFKATGASSAPRT